MDVVELRYIQVRVLSGRLNGVGVVSSLQKEVWGFKDHVT